MEDWAAMDQRVPLAEVADHARRAEALGYCGLNVPDAVHDGLLVSQEAEVIAALGAPDSGLGGRESRGAPRYSDPGRQEESI